MVPNEIGQKLHHRSTLGEALTQEELKTLKGWYAEQDAAEAAQLAKSRERHEEELAALQREIDNKLVDIIQTAESIRSSSAENDSLRERIRQLERELASKKQAQPA
jgi:septal ring factor EnvC (AmiA/AmiB activator)